MFFIPPFIIGGCHDQKRKKKTNRVAVINRRRVADLRKARRKQYRRRTNYTQRKKLEEEFHRRCQAVKQYLYLKGQPGISERQAAAEVASHFGISPSTLRRWAKSYQENGFKRLRPKSTRPKKIVKRVSQEVISLILAVRVIYGWGAQRIAYVFKEQGLGTFSHMFVQRLFDKHFVPVKVYHPRAPRNGVSYRGYQKRAGNQQWHIDFKGPLSIGPLKVWIFVCVDDATRFCLAVRVITSCNTSTVIDLLNSLFQRYGKPERICTDNGRAFVSVWEHGNHPFKDFLDDRGITHDLITPFYPESNGKAEALIHTIQQECLQWYLQTRHKSEFESSEELQKALDEFIEYYNWFRSHSALGYRSPGSSYSGLQPQQKGLGGLPDIKMLIPNHPLLQGNSKEPPPFVDENFRKQHLAIVPLGIAS